MKNYAPMRWFLIAVGIVFFFAVAQSQWTRIIKGQNDFAQLYAGATLVGTPDLYSRSANMALIERTAGFAMEAVVYTRPPFYAAILKPMALLPYRAAYALFTLASLASAVWFVIRFSKECRSLPVFAVFSVPMEAALCGGQDTPFLLAILGGAVLLTRRNMDFWAGLLLSLCAIKFHLFLFLPVLFLLKRRWRILGGGACGTAMLTGLGMLVAGPDALAQYVQVLRDPWINPPAFLMPNIHGLVAILHGPAWLELTLVAAVVLAFLWIVARCGDFDFLIAASLACGLLVSFHSFVADHVILLMAFALLAKKSVSLPMRSIAVFLLTPIAHCLILQDIPYSLICPISLLLLLGMFAFAILSPSPNLPETARA